MNEVQPASPSLAYVGLVVDEPARVAEMFASVLGLPLTHARSVDRADVPLVAIGDTAIALFARGDQAVDATTSTGVHHIAIAATQPERAAGDWGFATWHTRDGFDGQSVLELPRAATAGVRVRIAVPLELAPATSAAIERIDHIGVASADNQIAHQVFVGQFACPIESTQTDFEIVQPIESFTSDKYGVVHHSRAAEPIGGLRVSFLTIGDCELELLQPFSPHPEVADSEAPLAGGPGNTRGDKGAIGRYIERRGAGLHHLALKTPDIATTLTRLAEAGHRMIDMHGRPGSRRAQIGFIHPAALGGLLVHLVEREEI